ncbi:MAG: MBL fold metallo-hydrolase [Bacillota bacterium]|nr:MAG: MBL fold metallo-hydrolase [Bacillota bacterium]
MLLWSRALGEFGTNCYIIACPETRRAAVVDPGQPDPWIQSVVRSEGLQVEWILLTHGHLDHIAGVEWVREWAGAPVLCHPDEVPYLQRPELNLSALWGDPLPPIQPDRLVGDGEEVAVGRLRLRVIHTPGHTPGSISFYTPGHLLSGDALFAGSIGRTDLPGGNLPLLLRSIRERIFSLPGETVVYPGHGPTTTVADEQEYNPFAGGHRG